MLRRTRTLKKSLCNPRPRSRYHRAQRPVDQGVRQHRHQRRCQRGRPKQAGVSDDANVTPASGWIRDKGVLGPNTPDGDAILYGSAADFEDQASRPHAPKGAAGSAHLLYKRVAEYFPDSSLAPEAAWRSADIRWQVDKLDISTLPSAKEQEAYLRPQLYEGEMKKVMKNYPGSKFAALAAYDTHRQQTMWRLAGFAEMPRDGDGAISEVRAAISRQSESSRSALQRRLSSGCPSSPCSTVQEDRKRADAAAQRTQALARDLETTLSQD